MWRYNRRITFVLTAHQEHDMIIIVTDIIINYDVCYDSFQIHSQFFPLCSCRQSIGKRSIAFEQLIDNNNPKIENVKIML